MPDANKYFRVSPGCNVISATGELLKPGQLFEVGVHGTQKAADDNLASKYLMVADDYVKQITKDGNPNDLVENQPGVNQVAPLIDNKMDGTQHIQTSVPDVRTVTTQSPSGTTTTIIPPSVVPPVSNAAVSPANTPVATPTPSETAPGVPIGNTQPISVWSIDPATLNNKTLDELNVMVASIDPTIKAFDNVDEAKGQLTKDYKAPAL